MPRPAAGSAHHQPRAALAARPTSSTADNHAHSEVWSASDTAARDPNTGATLVLGPSQQRHHHQRQGGQDDPREAGLGLGPADQITAALDPDVGG
jgi:hypothetical protein